MTLLRQDVIDRRAFRRPLELSGAQREHAVKLLARTAADVTMLRPDHTSIDIEEYRLNDRFTFDADVDAAGSEVSGKVAFTDHDLKADNQVVYTRPVGDVLWTGRSTDSRSPITLGNQPNEAIIAQIRNAAPDLPIDPEFLKAVDDIALLRFLTHSLKRTGGKHRTHTRRWTTSEPQPHLRFGGSYTSDLVRSFSSSAVNGAQGYAFTTRVPGLPTADRHKVATQYNLEVKNINRKNQKIGAEIIYLGLDNEVGEDSDLTAHYAAEDQADVDDFLQAVESSTSRFADTIFTVDRLV